MRNLISKSQVLGLLIIVFFIVSCSNDDDSSEVVINTEFNDTSVKLDEEVETFIESDGKVTAKILGIFDDGDAVSVQKGFVYGTSTKPIVEGNDKVIEVKTNVRIEIKELEQNTTYYIRGFIKSNNGYYFYGNEISIKTPKHGDRREIKMIVDDTNSLGVSFRSIHLSVKIEELIGEAPTEVGVQYSLTENFSEFHSKKSDRQEIRFEGNYNVDIIFLSPSKTYYLRPYAKYVDNTILHGGTSVIEVTTNEPKVGHFYPLIEEDFSGSLSNSKYLVMEVDHEARTVLLVRKNDVEVTSGWKNSYIIEGELDVRNPSEEELIKMKEMSEFTISSNGVTAELLFFSQNVEDLTNDGYWTSEEDGEQNAYVYNPITAEKNSLSKGISTQKGRFVTKISY